MQYSPRPIPKLEMKRLRRSGLGKSRSVGCLHALRRAARIAHGHHLRYCFRTFIDGADPRHVEQTRGGIGNCSRPICRRLRQISDLSKPDGLYFPKEV